ncbi:protein-glutamate methylesterase/protein-glutamine glutaminase [Virgisporangium ochraceum]|uniref:Protein-glutamate methylesterase/protein-glutamine glutaminase n=1 Tax=Virgisporangium ochraceum TaxID=65505 RepID=A0A8J4EFH6_9ACTN|nr:chemotaxis response regulator protein-glutamate methylesterase [Virgisporangium ochraceum]GIJ70092.1 chemotaxis response regulator protein-glutamate methylesterase of group 2 operon [Virgisporangium ochraceum]
MSRRPISVLIVDDSAVVRQVLSTRLSGCPDIDQVRVAADPIFAMSAMNQSWPDVVVLDIEMPRMDGLTFLRRIMEVRPTPVIICSTLTQHGMRTTMDALAAGAVSVVPKPSSGLKKFMEDDSGDIVAAVRAAAAGNVRRLVPAARVAAVPAVPAVAVSAPTRAAVPVRAPSYGVGTDRVVAIGTSTGGTNALEKVLPALPKNCTGIVVVQHMPEQFTAAFAGRLDTMCAIDVMEAADGDRVLPGRALIAPGGKHTEVVRDGAQYRVRVLDGPPVNRHRPSVDVLFRSVARAAGANALGVIMTGMGDDGARGLLEMRRAGAATVAQDEATCVVYGMPKEAVQLGAVEQQAPLDSIAEVIRRHG